MERTSTQHPTSTLPGPAREIIVEPVESPAERPEPVEPPAEPQPARPAPEREPEPALP